jgi:hypothetical protein
MTEKAEVDLESLKHSDPSNVDAERPQPYKDPENLKTLYWDLEWSQSEIGDFYDVSHTTISRAMDEAGVEARPPMDERERRGIYRSQRPDFRAQYSIDNHGGRGDDETVTFYESNLVALQHEWVGLGDVFRESNDVDHLINSPLHINLPRNLRVLPREAHQATHVDDIQIPHEAFFELIGEPVPEEHDSRKAIYLDPSLLKPLPTINQETAEAED